MFFGDPLGKALASDDPAVRVDAVRTIGEKGKKKYSGLLLELLQREGMELKLEIAAVLGLFGDPSSIAPLAALLPSSDRRLRAAATQAMHKIHLASSSEKGLRHSYFLFGDPGVTFLLIVLDVFGVEGKSTVATGIIGTGSVATGDRLLLRKADGRDLRTTAEGIQPMLNTGKAPASGDSLGVFLRGLSMGEIGQGDSLVKVK